MLVAVAKKDELTVLQLVPPVVPVVPVVVVFRSASCVESTSSGPATVHAENARPTAAAVTHAAAPARRDRGGVKCLLSPIMVYSFPFLPPVGQSGLTTVFATEPTCLPGQHCVGQGANALPDVRRCRRQARDRRRRAPCRLLRRASKAMPVRSKGVRSPQPPEHVGRAGGEAEGRACNE